jgi:eukaryotic-like serine/threonine-protein kinase
MIAAKEINTEPIPGYRLIERLGSGGFGEVWKCEAPGGLFKAIKFVFGDLNAVDGDGARAEGELQAVHRTKAIRHPFLLSMDRVECIDGELVIVMELADQNLHQLWKRYRDAGQPGIPRKELLGYLREAAEVLDLMNRQCHLQHLDIKPHNLFLVSNHVKVGDFGLVSSVGGPHRHKQVLGAITPLYASPELFQGEPSRYSDQYSLAIVYQELLTGRLPFSGRNSRQLLLAHTTADPDLRFLAPPDQKAVAKALSKEPTNRFTTCAEFVAELSGNGGSQFILQAAKSKTHVAAGAALTDTDDHLVKTVTAEKPPPAPADMTLAYRQNLVKV